MTDDPKIRMIGVDPAGEGWVSMGVTKDGATFTRDDEFVLPETVTSAPAELSVSMRVDTEQLAAAFAHMRERYVEMGRLLGRTRVHLRGLRRVAAVAAVGASGHRPDGVTPADWAAQRRIDSLRRRRRRRGLGRPGTLMLGHTILPNMVIFDETQHADWDAVAEKYGDHRITMRAAPNPTTWSAP